MPPFISNWAFVPLDYLGKRASKIRATLTVRPKKYGDEPSTPIKVFSDDVPGYLGLPVDWALNEFPELAFENRTTAGEPAYHHKLPDPNHPRAAAGQAQFMTDLRAACGDYFTVLAKAPTGSGKTVTFLDMAARRGRRTLIMVPLQRLARQWAFEINDKLGVPLDDIGWVQGDVCNFDHPYVIAIGKSLTQRRYPAPLYRCFGTVGFDEGHRLGGLTFSAALGLFDAELKVAMSAGFKRKDGADKVYFFYFGAPKVEAQVPALPAHVHSLEYRCTIPSWATRPSHIAKLLGEDPVRNALIIRVALKLYERGRQALFIGDSVEHLQRLAKDAIAAGIPAAVIGLYVDQLYTDDMRDSYARVGLLARGDRAVYWGPSEEGEPPLMARGTMLRVQASLGGMNYHVAPVGSPVDAAPVTVHATELRAPSVRKRVMKKVSHDTLDRIGANCALIFATFGMLKEGVDIPRLDSGMDVSPRADGEQAIGRTRRPLPNKPMPVWYTLRDRGHVVTERMWASRVKDFEACNCKVEYHGPVG